MIKPRNAPICSTDAGKTMRLLGEAHELRLHTCAFERYEGLFALLNRTAMVMLIVDDERGCLGVA